MAEEKSPIEAEAVDQEKGSMEQQETAEEMPQEADYLGQLEELNQKAEENYSRYLRVQADFDNFRKRTRKEKEEMLQYASLPLIEALLPAIDNLERALLAGGESAQADTLMKGVDMVYRQVKQVLEKEGLKEIEALDKPFDPTYHQAVMQETDPEKESGIVLQELQKGYVLKDRVIRPSMVKVNA
jgi:molecular chaperone GrpE